MWELATDVGSCARATSRLNAKPAFQPHSTNSSRLAKLTIVLSPWWFSHQNPLQNSLCILLSVFLGSTIFLWSSESQRGFSAAHFLSDANTGMHWAPQKLELGGSSFPVLLSWLTFLSSWKDESEEGNSGYPVFSYLPTTSSVSHRFHPLLNLHSARLLEGLSSQVGNFPLSVFLTVRCECGQGCTHECGWDQSLAFVLSFTHVQLNVPYPPPLKKKTEENLKGYF